MDFLDLGGIRIRRLLYPPGCTQGRHAHSGTSVTLVAGGSLEETVGRTVERAGPLSVVVKPEGTEHANRIGPKGANTLQVWFSPATTRELLEWDAPLTSWRWTHESAHCRSLLRLMQFVRSPPADATEHAAEIVYDMVAELGRFRHEPPRGEAPKWLKEAREFIDDSTPHNIRVRDAAAHVNVHPVYLARQFRRYYGSTVVTYIKTGQVRRAAALIGGSSEPLTGVAYRAGFADQAHLCRDFKSATGLTPLTFRRIAGSA